MVEMLLRLETVTPAASPPPPADPPTLTEAEAPRLTLAATLKPPLPPPPPIDCARMPFELSAVGRQTALGVDFDRTGAAAAGATARNADRGAEFQTRRCGDREAAIAAAAADRLRNDGRGCVAISRDVVGGRQSGVGIVTIDIDIAAGAARPAGTAERDGDRTRRHRPAAIAAAAADRLREDARATPRCRRRNCRCR